MHVSDVQKKDQLIQRVLTATLLAIAASLVCAAVVLYV
jgi:hypothetical protein